MNTNVADTTQVGKPSILHVAEAKYTEMSIHPLFAAFCSPATIVKPNDSHRNIQTLHDAENEFRIISDELDFPIDTGSETKINVDSITDRNKLIDLQKADQNLFKLRSQTLDNPQSNDHSYFFVQDDMLMHNTLNDKTNYSADRIVVPSTLRFQVLQLAHDIPAAGHLGIRKTHARLQPHFYWQRMLKYVMHFCKSCDVGLCQRTNALYCLLAPARLQFF